MKSYIVNLEWKNEIRSIDELNTMLNYAIENENYELCSLIKKVIDNYDELVAPMAELADASDLESECSEFESRLGYKLKN